MTGLSHIPILSTMSSLSLNSSTDVTSSPSPTLLCIECNNSKLLYYWHNIHTTTTEGGFNGGPLVIAIG